MKPDVEMRDRKLIGSVVVCGGLVLAAVGLGSGVANAAPAPGQVQLAAFHAPAPSYGGFGPHFNGPRPHFRGGFGRGFGRGHYGRGFDRGHYGRGFGRGRY